MKPLVYISILNWHNAADTIECLASMQDLDYDNYQVIVVDNHSQDDSVERIKGAYPDIRLLVSDRNLGYAGGNELALQVARDEGAALFWIINNDTLIRPDTLGQLVEAYLQLGDAVYGSIAVNEHDHSRVELMAWGVAEDGYPRWRQDPKTILLGQNYNEFDPETPYIRVAHVTGMSMLIPLNVIEQYGFMDKQLFLYVEEDDYCCRLYRHSIPSYIVVPSVVIHKISRGTRLNERLFRAMDYYKERNTLIVIRRHLGYREYWILAAKNLFHYLFRSKRSISYNRYKLLGIRDALLNRMGCRLNPEDFLSESQTIR